MLSHCLLISSDQFRSVQTVFTKNIYKKNEKYTILPAHDKPTAWLHWERRNPYICLLGWSTFVMSDVMFWSLHVNFHHVWTVCFATTCSALQSSVFLVLQLLKLVLLFSTLNRSQALLIIRSLSTKLCLTWLWFTSCLIFLFHIYLKIITNSSSVSPAFCVAVSFEVFSKKVDSLFWLGRLGWSCGCSGPFVGGCCELPSGCRGLPSGFRWLPSGCSGLPRRCRGPPGGCCGLSGEPGGRLETTSFLFRGVGSVGKSICREGWQEIDKRKKRWSSK